MTSQRFISALICGSLCVASGCGESEGVGVVCYFGGPSHYVPLTYSDEFVESVSIGAVNPDLGPTAVLLKHEVLNAHGDYDEELYRFDASFHVLQVAASAPHKIFLMGVDADGAGVLEVWERADVHAPGAVEAFLQGPSESKTYAMTRTRLYTEPKINNPKLFGVDPDERFVLILHAPPASPAVLSRLPLSANAGISVEFDATQIPMLESATALFPATHSRAGRIWTITSMGAPSRFTTDRVTLVDSNNDGEFESFERLDSRAFQELFGDPRGWIADGVNVF